MPLNLRKIASECRLRAAEYKKKAERTFFHSDRRSYSDMARQWFVIAEGYETHLKLKHVSNKDLDQRTMSRR
jgi:hypothetical protein